MLVLHLYSSFICILNTELFSFEIPLFSYLIIFVLLSAAKPDDKTDLRQFNFLNPIEKNKGINFFIYKIKSVKPFLLKIVGLL